MVGLVTCLLAGLLASPATSPMTGAQVQARMDAAAQAGQPLVVHVVVALCDNQHQNIVPVKPILGNGQDPANNLYWGALYGVAKHLIKSKVGYLRVEHMGPLPRGVLERVVLRKRLSRGGKPTWVYLVAEAWDGARIKDATARFLRLAAGLDRQVLKLSGRGLPATLEAGGAAHLVVYVGHDGLMDFDPPVKPKSAADAKARSVAVFACASADYFAGLLERSGAHRLAMTTGLMAPEAYLVEALVGTWMGGRDAKAVREALARAYQRYQKCGLKAARGLFSGYP